MMCSFLDNLTEELGEDTESKIYDDYKFVTKKALQNIGFTYPVGSLFSLGLYAWSFHGYNSIIRLMKCTIIHVLMKHMGKIRSTKDKRSTCKKNPIKEIAKS